VPEHNWEQIDTGILQDMVKSGYGVTDQQRLVFKRMQLRLKQDWKNEKELKKPTNLLRLEP